MTSPLAPAPPHAAGAFGDPAAIRCERAASELRAGRPVLVEDAARGFLLGFLTREFTLERAGGSEPMVAVYVPTNHLYLGDVLVLPHLFRVSAHARHAFQKV